MTGINLDIRYMLFQDPISFDFLIVHVFSSEQQEMEDYEHDENEDHYKDEDYVPGSEVLVKKYPYKPWVK